MEINAINLFIIISATWRISSLFANETGPFYVFVKLREYCNYLCKTNKFCSALHLYELIECEWCNSVWFGTLFTILWLFIGHTFIVIILPLTISAWAIFIKYLVEFMKKGGE